MNRPARPTLIAALSLALVPACAPAPPPPAPEKPREVARYSVEALMGTSSIFGASFSPDRTKILVSSKASGIYNAQALPVAGGNPIPLTRSTADPILVEGYFPADERFLYRSAPAGTELHHLYVQAVDGSVKDLTPGKDLRADFAGWSPDDRFFFVLTNERDSKFRDLYEYAIDGYARKRIFKDTVGCESVAISPDRKMLACGKSKSSADSDVFLVDVATGKAKRLTAHEGEARNQPQQFSPDGKFLYFLTNEGNDFDYLVRYDLAAGTKETVEKPSWDVLAARLSKRGRYLAVGINNDARTEMKLYELPGMTPVKLPEFPAGLVTNVRFSGDESMLAFYLDSSRAPSSLYVVDLAGGEPRQLTRSFNANIDAADLVEGQVVRFRSADGVEIPGILYRPIAASAGHKVPAVVFVHAGLGGQSRLSYNDLIQFLVNRGFAVYAINNRGSSGYGKAFLGLDDRKHGEADLDDCVASKKMLADTGWIDPERIGILGESYGGYLVLAALALRPEEFQAGVDLFGVSDWVRTLSGIPASLPSMRQAFFAEVGDPVKDAEQLNRVSPAAHAAAIKRPLLIVQGGADPRVAQTDTDQIVAAVKANGVPVQYILFNDEAHGFVHDANEITANKAILDFLDKHLAAPAPPPAR